VIRADIAVLGGGLAARWVAARCAPAAKVVRLAPVAPSPAPATDRSLGIVAAGGHDSPVRIAHAVGDAAARELWTFSRAASERLLGLDPGARRGVWRVAMHDSERQEWDLARRLLASWGLPDGEAADGAGLESRVGRGVRGGVRLADDGCVDLRRAVAALDDVELLPGAATIARADDGVLVQRDGAEPVRAEIAVVAAGVGSGAVHPFFADLLYPVRVQARRSAPGGGRAREAAVARHRHEAWAPTDDGGLEFLGCRWAEQPEMGAGEVDDATLSEAVSDRQDAFVATHLGGGEVTRRWAGIAAYSCDGLPIVGPLPGAPRIVALAGWCGWGLSWIGEAVEVVARAMLGETEERPLPGLLAARRML